MTESCYHNKGIDPDRETAQARHPARERAPSGCSEDLLLEGESLNRGQISELNTLRFGNNWFQDVINLTPEITGFLVTPDLDAGKIKSALRLCDIAFPGDLTATWELQRIYRQIRNGDNVMPMLDRRDSDFGNVAEWSGFFIYERDERVSAIGGLYRYWDQPQDFWIGRLAVSSEEMGSGLARDVVCHLMACAELLKGTSMRAYTEESPDNGRAFRFYEKLGFRNDGETFIAQEIRQRVYYKDLST